MKLNIYLIAILMQIVALKPLVLRTVLVVWGAC